MDTRGVYMYMYIHSFEGPLIFKVSLACMNVVKNVHVADIPSTNIHYCTVLYAYVQYSNPLYM